MTLTQERLREVLYYNPETGVFNWRNCKSPKMKARAVAGSKAYNGYFFIHVDGKSYPAHRLVWLYVYGYFPENSIDHINRTRGDNRLANLREASSQCQSRNRGHQIGNVSGIKGVTWDKQSQKWRAIISSGGGKHSHLGMFTDKLEAAYHRYAAEQCLGFHDCDLTSSALKFIKSQDRSIVYRPPWWNDLEITQQTGLL